MHFLNKLQKGTEISEQPLFVFSVTDELRSKQHLFETFEVRKVKRPNNPHHWVLRDLAQNNVFQNTLFSN